MQRRRGATGPRALESAPKEAGSSPKSPRPDSRISTTSPSSQSTHSISEHEEEGVIEAIASGVAGSYIQSQNGMASLSFSREVVLNTCLYRKLGSGWMAEYLPSMW